MELKIGSFTIRVTRTDDASWEAWALNDGGELERYSGPPYVSRAQALEIARAWRRELGFPGVRIRNVETGRTITPGFPDAPH